MDENQTFNLIFFGESQNSDETLKDLIRVFPKVKFGKASSDSRHSFLNELENVTTLDPKETDQTIQKYFWPKNVKSGGKYTSLT